MSNDIIRWDEHGQVPVGTDEIWKQIKEIVVHPDGLTIRNQDGTERTLHNVRWLFAELSCEYETDRIDTRMPYIATQAKVTLNFLGVPRRR